MGKAQRDKGLRAERDFAKRINGVRVPLSGAAGGEYCGDVKGMGLLWECKVRNNGFKMLYEWLTGVDALAVKADHKNWLVVLPIDTFINMTKTLKYLNDMDGHEVVREMLELRKVIAQLKEDKPSEYDTQALGNRLVKIREIRNDTIEDVAEFVEVTSEQVAEWENNISRPTLEHMIMLSRFYNVSVRYIEKGLIETGEARADRLGA